MGSRTATDTITGIVAAFWRDRTWSQASLARALGLTTRSLRKHLDELVLRGWPLEREEDHPHVYWSVPSDWFPAGVLLDADDLGALLHLLVRVPDGVERARLLAAISRSTPELVSTALDRVLPAQTTPTEEALLPAVLDAAVQRVALQCRYFTASRGALTDRVISVQRVLPGPPARFIGHCHTVRDLRWFRLDFVTSLRKSTTGFVDVEDELVEAMLSKSVDGFYAGDETRVVFFIHSPEARWAAKMLPEGLEGVDVDGGFLVDCTTNGLLPVARFVVGLGKAAECRSPELRRAVEQLARGALGQEG